MLKKNRKRRKRSSSSFSCSAHSHRCSCPSEVQLQHMLATFGDNSGEKRQQTLNNYIKGALSSPLFHLSFVCFMCFTSFRTNPSSPLAAAAKYRSYSSGNEFLSSCSSFLEAFACFFSAMPMCSAVSVAVAQTEPVLHQPSTCTGKVAPRLDWTDPR